MSKNQSSEIRINFIHPYTGAVLEARVNSMLTLDEILGALINEGFISAPAKWRGSLRYALGTEHSSIRVATDTLQDLGATDGCEVRIVSVCID